MMLREERVIKEATGHMMDLSRVTCEVIRGCRDLMLERFTIRQCMGVFKLGVSREEDKEERKRRIYCL